MDQRPGFIDITKINLDNGTCLSALNAEVSFRRSYYVSKPEDISNGFYGALLTPWPKAPRADANAIISKVISVVGPIGCGKTELCKAIAFECLGNYGEADTEILFGRTFRSILYRGRFPKGKHVWVIIVDDAGAGQDSRSGMDGEKKEETHMLAEIRHLLLEKAEVNEGIVIVIENVQLPSMIDKRFEQKRFAEIYKAALEGRNRLEMQNRFKQEGHYDWVPWIIDNSRKASGEPSPEQETAKSRALTFPGSFGDFQPGYLSTTMVPEWFVKKIQFISDNEGESKDDVILDELIADFLSKSIQYNFWSNSQVGDKQRSVELYLEDIQKYKKISGRSIGREEEGIIRTPGFSKKMFTKLSIKMPDKKAQEFEQKRVWARSIIEFMENDVMRYTPRTKGAKDRVMIRAMLKWPNEHYYLESNWPMIWKIVCAAWDEKYPIGPEAKQVAESARETAKEAMESGNVLRSVGGFPGIDFREVIRIAKGNDNESERKCDYDALEFSTIGNAGDLDENGNPSVYSVRELTSKNIFGVPLKSDAAKQRLHRARGKISTVLGSIFEEWMAGMLKKGYELPYAIENIEEVVHGGGESEPDIVVRHKDGSYSVLSLKARVTERSESFAETDFMPEIAEMEKLRAEGRQAKMFILYTNVIRNTLAYRAITHRSQLKGCTPFRPDESTDGLELSKAAKAVAEYNQK
ncbi:MAG: AAA family ATPase [Candidatus Thermoplasmatota archaeon]|nr:AAA family ATPase [Candidatus Thermoplasmatota archaeon]